MVKSGEKRPITMDEVEKAAERIENTIQNSMGKEVKSSEIGNLVMKELKDMDEVSYVRFASVYREFKDIESFAKELDEILKEKKD